MQLCPKEGYLGILLTFSASKHLDWPHTLPRSIASSPTKLGSSFVCSKVNARVQVRTISWVLQFPILWHLQVPICTMLCHLFFFFEFKFDLRDGSPSLLHSSLLPHYPFPWYLVSNWWENHVAGGVECGGGVTTSVLQRVFVLRTRFFSLWRCSPVFQLRPSQHRAVTL